MIEMEILVDHRYRQQFDEIIKESKMEVVKEEKTSTEVGSWVTIQMYGTEDAYWLGRNYEQVINKRYVASALTGAATIDKEATKSIDSEAMITTDASKSHTHFKDEFASHNSQVIEPNHDNYIELHGIVIQPDGKFYSKPETCYEKEDSQSKDIKERLYSELNEEAPKANYIKYSPDKLVRGQFGKYSQGPGKPIEYVLLSDKFLNRKDSFPAYFYLLRIQTISCGSFCKETGERGEGYKVIEMEDIDEAKALERYNKFLSVWKE